MPATSTTRAIIAGAIGNVVEWYDFGLYGLLAPMLASVFFPSHDRIAALLGVYGGFAVGFAVRPLGAIVLGRVGDRQGRQFVLVLSVALMGAATVAVGVLPSYKSVGIWAPVLLILIRLFQGFSVGGEFVGSVTYLVEAAPMYRRGIAGSMANVGATVGMLIAAGAATLTASNAQAAWAWRVPFFFGGALALAGYLLRRHMPRDGVEKPALEENEPATRTSPATEQAAQRLFSEGGGGFKPRMSPAKSAGCSPGRMSSAKLTGCLSFLRSPFNRKDTVVSQKGTGFSQKGTGFSPCDAEAESTGALAPEGRLSPKSPKAHPSSGQVFPRKFLARWPALDAFRRAPRTMLFALIFCCGYGVSNYVIMVFLPTFAHEFAGITNAAALKINTAGQAMALLIAPLAGWLSDRWIRRRTLLALAFAAQAGVAWECFRWAAHAGIAGLWAAQLLLAALLAAVMGAAPAMLAEQFAHGYRVSAHAFVLNVGVGIAGGTAPMVAVALIGATRNTMAPAAYLALACIASAIAALLLADRSREALNGESEKIPRVSELRPGASTR